MLTPINRKSRISRSALVACQPLERRMLLSLAPAGPEFRVNTFTTNLQTEPAMAMDGDGDFVVVWQSFSQEPSYGIYAQRYNAAGVPQGGELHVNTFFTNGQSGPTVAMDADGDFVVAWQSYFQDGSGYAVMAQRYNAAGTPQGSEFRVNTYTTNYQFRPAVAMDAAGNFVIAWTSIGQDGSSDGVYAQRYNFAGAPQGGEFRVNTYTTMIQARPSVALDAVGNFLIAWESQGQDGAGYGVYAQRYNRFGNTDGPEFKVHSFTTGRQSDAAVAMDLSGDFVITWDSSGQDGSSYGVYAQRYNTAGVAQGGEFRVNTQTTNGQFFPTIAMDADGDLLVAWQSELQDGALSGVYAQQYSAAGAAIGGEFRVNSFTTSDQIIPAVAADHKGDYVVSWVSNNQEGAGGSYGIYAQRYQESTDAAGPVVAGMFINNKRVLPYSTHQPALQQIVVSFSEDMNVTGGSSGANSVTNPANWLLTRDGFDITSNISFISFGFNAATNRYEAVLNLSTSHTSGNFLVQARDTLRDAAGTALDGNADGAPGGSFALPFSVALAQPTGGEFRVSTFTTDAQLLPSIASDADGEFVVVWRSQGQDGDGFGVYGQRYNAAGAAQGGEFRVNTFTTEDQTNPTVALDAVGNFVVTWTSFGQEGVLDAGIYAQRYNAAGIPQGTEFHVNTFTTGLQSTPRIAMDADGDFVITWTDSQSNVISARRYNAAGIAQGGVFQVGENVLGIGSSSVAMSANGAFVVSWTSSGQDGSGEGVYARRYYSPAGIPQGGEFRVNTHTTGNQNGAGVAVDADGDFVIAWNSVGQVGPGWSTHAQRYNAAGAPQGGEFQVSSFTTGILPVAFAVKAAMDMVGNFVITWTTNGQDGDGYGVYARRYSASGVPHADGLRVNTYTTGRQTHPWVAMDADGDLVVAWTSYGQDGSSSGIYAQRYVLDNTPTVGTLADTPDPVAEGDTITLSASNVTDDGTVTSVSFYRESNDVAGLQVGFEGDTLVGTDTDGSDGWSADIATTGLSAGTYAYWAQATDDANLIGTPASTTNQVQSSFPLNLAPHRLLFAFNANVSASLGTEDIVLENLTTMQTIPPSDLSVSYDLQTNVATFTYIGPGGLIPSVLADGNYRATLLAAGITDPNGVPLPANIVFNFFFLSGDANGDGRVNLNDFNILAANFGQSPRDFTQGDFNYDTVVNLADFNILASRFGQVLGPSVSAGSGLFSDKSVDLRQLMEELRYGGLQKGG